MTNVIQVLDEVKRLSNILYDPSKRVTERMLAAIQISDLVADPLIESIARSLDPPAEEKPKVRWVNGAKVRVK